MAGKKPQLSKDNSYDPVEGQSLSINTIFNREEYIKKCGIQLN